MTNEELVYLIQQGNTDKIIELWQQTKKLISLKARQYLDNTNFSPDFLEDLEQAGYIALVNAVASYHKKEYKFNTFLSYHLQNAFREALGIRTEKQEKDPIHNAAGIDAPLTDKEGESFSLADIIGADDPELEGAEDRLEREELREILLEEISRLPEKEADSITKHFFHGLTFNEIGKQEGVSGVMIRQRQQQGIRKIRRRAGRSGLDEFLEDLTPYYKGGSVDIYNRTQTSAVEAAVMKRERLEHFWYNNKKFS